MLATYPACPATSGLMKVLLFFTAILSLATGAAGQAAPKIPFPDSPLSDNSALDDKVLKAIYDIFCLQGSDDFDILLDLYNDGRIREIETPVPGHEGVGGASNSSGIWVGADDDDGAPRSVGEIATTLRHELDHYKRAKAASDANGGVRKTDPEADPNNPALGGTKAARAQAVQEKEGEMALDDADFLCTLGAVRDCIQYDAETGDALVDTMGNPIYGPSISNNVEGDGDAMGENEVKCQEIYDIKLGVIEAAVAGGAITEQEAEDLKDDLSDDIIDNCGCQGGIEK